MSILFSAQCEYAIQGILWIASKPYGTLTSARELSHQLSLPYHFMSKILNKLTKKGVVSSLKGPYGGFRLNIPAQNINLLKIIEAIDGLDFYNRCVLGYAHCTSLDPCPVHHDWNSACGVIMDMLTKKNVVECIRKDVTGQENEIPDSPFFGLYKDKLV